MSSGDKPKGAIHHVLRGTILTPKNWAFHPYSDGLLDQIFRTPAQLAVSYQTMIRSLGMIYNGGDFWVGMRFRDITMGAIGTPTGDIYSMRLLPFAHEYLIPLDRKTIMRYENYLFRDETGSGRNVCHPFVYNSDLKPVIARLLEPKE